MEAGEEELTEEMRTMEKTVTIYSGFKKNIDHFPTIRNKMQVIQLVLCLYKDMNKEKKFVYHVTVVRITLSIMFVQLYF